MPQGSIAGPILFNVSIHDLFYIIEKASIFNFTDDTTLSAFSKTIEGLLQILQSESLKTIKWFKGNKMIVNADKFQVLLIGKRKQDHTNEVVQIEEQSIKAVPSVELLGTEIDDKINFNLHISKFCNSAANQLNAMTRLRNFMTFNVKEALINSYFMSNFNYCP